MTTYNGKRIAWIIGDVASLIHKTMDEGQTTLCRLTPLSEKDWNISEVPCKGKDKYCCICFAYGGREIPWVDKT